MMTRSTSTTSTMGVTLMPVMGAFLPRPPRVPAMTTSVRSRRGDLAQARRDRRLGRLRSERGARGMRRTTGLQERADVLRERGQVALDVADTLLDDVVRDDRGDRDEETHARRDERLGDAAHDGVH